MKIIIDNNDVKVSLIEKPTNTVAFCFTGIGHAMGGVDVQRDEFFRLTNDSSVIFITDKKRSWGNNLDFENIKGLISHYIVNKKLFAIGNSMGGFLAVIASRYFTFETVIAFSPQFSIKDTVVPWETRWRDYVAEITCWQYESLVDCFNDNCQYYIFSVGHNLDGKQIGKFPTANNIHKLIINNENWGHTLAAELKLHHVLYEVIAGCLMHLQGSRIKKIINDKQDNKILFL